MLVWRWGLRWLGLGVALLAAVLNGLAVTVFYVPVAPLVPALRSVWFVIHIAAALLSGAAFNVGGLAAIAYLLKSRAESRGRTGGLVTKLPASAAIDRLSYRVLAFSFPIWTFTIATGAIRFFNQTALNTLMTRGFSPTAKVPTPAVTSCIAMAKAPR